MKKNQAFQMNQREVWDKIAAPWSHFRSKTVDEVKDFLKDKKGKILDLGCGSGRNFVKLPKGSLIYGVDFSKNQLNFARRRADKNRFKVKLVNAEVWKTGFENNFFDTALFVAVLHCIPNAEKRKLSLKELLRILKPGAEVFITVWNHDQKKFENSGKEEIMPWNVKGKTYQRYYYLYDRKEFVNLLKLMGFEIVKVYDKNNNSKSYSQRNIVVIARKPYLAGAGAAAAF